MQAFNSTSTIKGAEGYIHGRVQDQRNYDQLCKSIHQEQKNWTQGVYTRVQVIIKIVWTTLWSATTRYLDLTYLCESFRHHVIAKGTVVCLCDPCSDSKAHKNEAALM